MSEPRPIKSSAVKRFGVGAAIVALPVAAAVTVWELKQQDDANNDELERGFKYDDAALRQVDPALIAWKEAGQIQTGMSKPTCIAVLPDGRLLVGGDQAAKVLDAGGRELLSFPIAGQATAIAGSRSGDIYVALKDHIEVHGPDGVKRAQWGSVGAGGHISSIAVGEKAIYVADSGLRFGRALIYGFDGSSQGELAKARSADGVPGIITPSPHMDIAVASDGNIWVANPGRHQLELYSPTGELQRAFGQGGTGIDQFLGCCNPSDFALLSDGRIVTAEKGVPRIKLYKDDGHFVNVVAAPASFGGNRAGLDIAADGSGNVLVLEPGTSTIRVFAENKS